MLSELFITPEAKVRDALRQLEETEGKTLFVVTPDQTLFGTLTDGDVRRWILSGGDLDGSVDRVCNTAPCVASEADPAEHIRREMLSRNINSIPVVGPDGKIKTVVTWSQLFADSPQKPARPPITLPVVIMAGGRGTRLAPFTSVLPKPLIPLGDKTVIELIVESFTCFGVSDFYLSVNYKSKIIKSYFDELDPPYSVRYIYEDKPLGTAGSLRALSGHVTDDLIVTNCDVIIRADLHDLVAHHAKDGNDITLVASLRNYSIPYGVCEIGEDGRLRRIMEKPEFNFLVNTGLYVLKPHVLELIPDGELFHITDLIEKCLVAGGRVGVFPISDKAWIDTGEWAQYRSAVAEITGERRRMPR
jgi:dTDP-glucose pyrophosphorylase